MPPFLVREHSSLPLSFVAWGGVERQSIMILLRALYVVEQGHSPRTGGVAPRNRYRARLYLPILLLLASLVFVSCSGLNFGGTPAKVTPTVGSSQEALSQLHWCGKPLMIFRDEGAPPPSSVTPTATATTTGTPTATVGNTPTATATATPSTNHPVTITDWSQVKPNLGFVVYLPESLPQNSCLVSASGTIHDPIFGGSFTIGYLLPDHSSISLAEAPVRSQSHEFQCSPSSVATPHASGTPTPVSGPAQAALQLCSGARDNTSIVFSAGGSTNSLQQFFDALQPNVNWVPAS